MMQPTTSCSEYMRQRKSCSSVTAGSTGLIPTSSLAMPGKDSKTLETAEREGWPASKIAVALEVDVERAEDLLAAFQRAREVVDAENPAEAFRNGVRFSIWHALEEGLGDPEAIEKLVTQICYCAANLAFLLEREGKTLSRYSRHL